MMKSKPLYSTVVYQSPSNATLTIYKAKKAKLVYLLSSTHKTVCVDETYKKKLPETIKYYNLSKVGVDVLDQMARYHTCKSATRRWPVAVFFNIIDCVCKNAFIIYREVIGHRLTRRQFLLQLINEMCCDPPPVTAPSTLHGMAEASSVKIHERESNVSLSNVETSPAALAIDATKHAVATTLQQLLLLPRAPPVAVLLL